MNQLMGAVQMMSSLDLLVMINEQRSLSGEPVIENNKFIAKVEDELDDISTDDKKSTVVNRNNQSYYTLTLEQCTLVGMRESKAVRRSVLAKLKELEAPAFAIPSTLSGALMLAAKQAEQIEAQQAQLALAAPKVAFVQNYVAANTGSKGFREICKLLNVKEPAFREFLTEQGIMYRLGGVWTPSAQHMTAGRMEVKTGVNTGTGHAFNHALFTPKGVEWIAGVWARHCVKQACGVAA